MPKNLKIKVRGATRIRYFTLRGETPDELMEAAAVRSERHCDHPGALACVRQKFKARTSETIRVSTGRCSITGISTTLTSTVFAPRWITAERVDPAMLAWWKQVLKKISKHEARHIAIQKDGLAKFRRQIIGQPCPRFVPAFRRTSRQVEKAQIRFDERERGRPWPRRP